MPGRQGLVLIAHDCEPTVQLLASMQEDDGYAVALALPETLRRRAIQVLARMLREDGFFVVVAEETRDALRCLARNPGPEALILDESTPRGAPNPVLEYARQRNPSMPAFVLSSSRKVELSPTFRGSQPILLRKPIEYGRLRLELNRILRSHTGQMLRVVDATGPVGTAASNDDKKKT